VKPTQAHLDAAYAAAMACKDTGKSPTADMRRYSDAIAVAVLAMVPEPKATRKRKP
jgi:bifunctional DNase/RNase